MELISEGEIEDSFGLEDVMEMMAAYLPGFEKIERASVIEWMFNLSSRLSDKECPEKKDQAETDKGECENADEGCSVKETDKPLSNPEVKFPSYDFLNLNGVAEVADKVSSPVCDKLKSQDLEPKDEETSSLLVNPVGPLRETKPSKCWKRKGRQISVSSQESQEDSSDKMDISKAVDASVRTLLEMFPASCSVEARHCLEVSGGDLEQAVQLIIDRQENGQAIAAATQRKEKKSHKVKTANTNILEDDESIKSSVLQKYSYVDTADDNRTHKPRPLEKDEKKMIRYRDGQIVSKKGERFSEIKTQDTEEMKKTYVNLKPARKYRFH